MNLIKLILTLIGILVVLVLGINLVGHAVMATSMTDLLGAKVKVGKVHFDPIKARAGIYDLRVQNPEGFEEKYLAEIPEVSLALNFSNILKGEIIVSEARLNIEAVTVERNKSKNFNLLGLKPLKDVLSGSDETTPSEQPEKTDDKKSSPIKVIIQEAFLSVGKASYVDYAKEPVVRKEVALGMKDARLSNIETTRELVQEVVKKIMAKVSLNALIPDWSQLSASLGVAWDEKVTQVKSGVSDLMEKIKGSFNKDEKAA